MHEPEAQVRSFESSKHFRLYCRTVAAGSRYLRDTCSSPAAGCRSGFCEDQRQAFVTTLLRCLTRSRWTRWLLPRYSRARIPSAPRAFFPLLSRLSPPFIDNSTERRADILRRCDTIGFFHVHWLYSTPTQTHFTRTNPPDHQPLSTLLVSTKITRVASCLYLTSLRRTAGLLSRPSRPNFYHCPKLAPNYPLFYFHPPGRQRLCRLI